jgi:hypothetical protein
MREPDATPSRWQAGETNPDQPTVPRFSGFAENFVNQGVQLSRNV